MIATSAIADITKAPIISETEGKATDTTQTTSQIANLASINELKLYLAQEVAKYLNPKDYFTLYNVIQCESSWRIDAKNKDSTASGLAQFLDGTWNRYCKGDKKNSYDQISCLVKAWKEKHQSWWNESKFCWGKYLTN